MISWSLSSGAHSRAPLPGPATLALALTEQGYALPDGGLAKLENEVAEVPLRVMSARWARVDGMAEDCVVPRGHVGIVHKRGQVAVRSIPVH
jgi:hypothetical protein